MASKMVRQVAIKSDDDVFHEIFRDKPHHITNMAPSRVQGCVLHEGEWGKVGSIIFWNYTHNEKEKVARNVIEAVDEANKLVTCKMIEGDLKQLYKTFSITVHVDTSGVNKLVTWTFQYMKLNDGVEDANTLMDFCISGTKDIKVHHLK